ncbi:hypothetical protein E4T81_11750 [Barnesiella sp. WM24]|nr:hypothetical protein E4T81_11750 [Barnesiella sp. WM24]
MMMKFELRHIILILILAIMTGCTDTPVPAVAPSPDRAARPLSFTLSSATVEPASRSLVYDGLNTSFTEGTMIGCVIAFKDAEADGGYAYQANSCWTWHPDGLLLHKLYDADNSLVYHAVKPDEATIENTLIRHFTAEELAEQQPDAEPDPHALYYIKLLNETADYAFFFYYPYVDAEVLTTAVAKANGKSDDYGYTLYQWTGLAVENTLAFYVGNNSEADLTTKLAPWTQYPVIPLDDFSKGTGQERLENSDFMYGAVTEMPNEQPLNAENAKSEIPVTLQKQMVTMDFLFSETPDEGSVIFKPTSANNNHSMVRIRYFNMLTGKFDGEAPYEQYSSDQLKSNARYNKDIYPGKIDPVIEDKVKYTVYRVILTPQSASDLIGKDWEGKESSCDFTFKTNGVQHTLKHIARNPLLTELKGGYYYRLRFSKTGDDTGWHLTIDDWKEGGNTTLTRPD